MQDFESLRNQLPFKVIPTNIPGVFALPAPPEEVLDPNTVGTAALMRYGVHWCRPKESDHSAFRAAWKELFSRHWRAQDCIVPHLEPRVGRTHRLRGLKTTEGGYTDKSWSGGVLQRGQWPNVAGYWFVPTVSQPSEPPGPDGGWDSSSWIGIDGFEPSGSTDVLQAGIRQDVDSKGQASYYAWWEWFVPGADPKQFPYINQTNITSSQDGSPFLISAGDKIYCAVGYVRNNAMGQLYLANYTTGKYFSIIIAPPTGASFNASSIEWIMEAPGGPAPGGGEIFAALPEFTPVNFFQAFGWAAGEKAVGDPQNGDYVNIDNGVKLTSVTLGSLSVTIDFIG